MGTFFRPQVYKRAGISSVEVNKRVGKSVILPPFPLPQTSSRLASLADFFFAHSDFFVLFPPLRSLVLGWAKKGLQTQFMDVKEQENFLD